MELDLGLEYTGGIRRPTPDQIGYSAIVDATGVNLIYTPIPVGGLMVAPMVTIPGVAATPGWNILGKFYPPLAWTTSRLEAIITNATALLTTNIQIVRDSDLSVVAGSTLTVALTGASTRVVTAAAISLTAGVIYQVRGECTGGALNSDFSVCYGVRLV